MPTKFILDYMPPKTESKPKKLYKSNYVPSIEPSRISNRKIGQVVSYAANTHQGLVRDYNEDRLSIILNMLKPEEKGNLSWPKCSFFGIYDGHGGNKCADFLRDTLHNLIIKDDFFPSAPRKAIIRSIYKLESEMLLFRNQVDLSG